MIGCGKCISGLNTRQFVSVEARVVVILRRLVLVVELVGYSRFSEPVVIIGEMSNTVTYRQTGVVFVLILIDCLTVTKEYSFQDETGADSEGDEVYQDRGGGGEGGSPGWLVETQHQQHQKCQPGGCGSGLQ